MGTVFVSSRTTEKADVEGLEAALGQRWALLRHAVTPAAEASWRNECRRLIEAADVVVCVVGETTAESPNVEWELEVALAIGRPVVAVRASAAVAPRLPQPIADADLAEPAALLDRLRAHERAVA